MSLRNLVEDQCGAANSLVQLTTHFVEDRGLQDQGLLHPFQQHQNLDQHEVNKTIIHFIRDIASEFFCY